MKGSFAGSSNARRGPSLTVKPERRRRRFWWLFARTTRQEGT